MTEAIIGIIRDRSPSSVETSCSIEGSPGSHSTNGPAPTWVGFRCGLLNPTFGPLLTGIRTFQDGPRKSSTAELSETSGPVFPRRSSARLLRKDRTFGRRRFGNLNPAGFPAVGESLLANTKPPAYPTRPGVWPSANRRVRCARCRNG